MKEKTTLLPKDLHVCIMVVGTHGDILPFIGLGHKLQESGFRVTIATHTAHHHLVVQEHRFRFHQLAGDPKQLSAWMVQTGGTLVGEALNPQLLPKKTKMVQQIVESTFVDGECDYHAIIANPPVMGHIHVAERLGIPLHIMFPQPWYYGTKEFPHPMAGMPYGTKSRLGYRASYKVFESLTWNAFGGFINRWRIQSLGLPPIHAIQSTNTNFIVKESVPFSAMWSPSFVPQPSDWPSQCKVIGAFATNQKQNFDESLFAATKAWIEKGEKPIFVGFGSMVINDPAGLVDTICSAAEQTGTRIILQSNWTALESDQTKSDFLHTIGPCPHDWLLPQCAAVVHHGGAGTVAAGLRFGLPTFVCPFFADQFMWGHFVEQAGVGPAACPASKLSVTIFVDALQTLRSDNIQAKAKALASQMAMEDGISAGLDHFLEQLPLDAMVCDVSAFFGEPKVAAAQLVGSRLRGIKVSSEVLCVLQELGVFGWTFWFLSFISASVRKARRVYGARFTAHTAVKYNLCGKITTPWQGLVSAITGLIACCVGSVAHVYKQPAIFWKRFGLVGILAGLIVCPFYVLADALFGLIVFFDRLTLGFVNACFGTKLDFVFDWRSWKQRRIGSKYRSMSDSPKSTHQRKCGLEKAMRIICDARILFQHCGPSEQTKYSRVVVPWEKLQHKLMSGSASTFLTIEEVHLLLQRVNLAYIALEHDDTVQSNGLFVHNGKASLDISLTEFLNIVGQVLCASVAIPAV